MNRSLAVTSKRRTTHALPRPRPGAVPDALHDPLSRYALVDPLGVPRSGAGGGAAAPVQRILTIGKERYTKNDDFFDLAFNAGATALAIQNLTKLAAAEEETTFNDWEEAAEKTDYSKDPLALIHDPEDFEDDVERFGMPPQITETVSFRHLRSATFGQTLSAWMVAERRSTLAEVSDEKVKKALLEAQEGLLKAWKAREKAPKAVGEAAMQLQDLLTKLHLMMFTLQDRESTMKDGKGGNKAMYGYHMTKLHNIPSIRSTGLDPRMGATDRGSVGMSTEGQKKGSIQTSKCVVAFASLPSTFRPYINQAEDRRQMIDGVPIELKPLMLRFHIDAAIGRDNVIEGMDYMDGNALNTAKAIQPKYIEVLTLKGWVPIQQYDTRTQLAQLRSGNDDARTGKKWDGTKVVLDWGEVNNLGLFQDLVKKHSEAATAATSDLEKLRDKELYNKNGLKLTFRGATMQTSGSPQSWEYAFTATANELPSWLEKAAGRYVKDYKNKVDDQLLEYEKLKDQ
ncbi:MAG: hypothetical protein Q8P41_20550 [Pseudomonadota bacterium]|nr:hypothetical protein [Pseudomonadota bacterium]